MDRHVVDLVARHSAAVINYDGGSAHFLRRRDVATQDVTDSSPFCREQRPRSGDETLSYTALRDIQHDRGDLSRKRILLRE